MRVWIVTGASSGFGKVIARCALEQGDAVVGAARAAQQRRIDEIVGAAQ